MVREFYRTLVAPVSRTSIRERRSRGVLLIGCTVICERAGMESTCLAQRRPRKQARCLSIRSGGIVVRIKELRDVFSFNPKSTAIPRALAVAGRRTGARFRRRRPIADFRRMISKGENRIGPDNDTIRLTKVNSGKSRRICRYEGVPKLS